MSYGTLTVATLHGLLFLIKYGASGDLDLSSPTSVFVWQVSHGTRYCCQVGL